VNPPSTSTVGSGEPAPLSASQANYALYLLLVVMVVCHIDRNILNILLEPIKREFGVSDTLMGFLTGPVFAIFYTLAGLPLALIADRTSRKRVLVIGLAFWSLMTAVQGWVRSFGQLATARLLVGVGEATCGPNSHAILSDAFPPARRATALAIFSLGGHIGMLIGFVFGGFANDVIGWRNAFIAVGLPGVLLAWIVSATLPAPPRAHHETTSFRETLTFLWRKRTFRQLALSASLYTLAAYSFNVWGSSFLIRTHGWSTTQAGTWFGLATGVTGILGSVVAGKLADSLWQRDPRWGSWISAIGGIAMVPFAIGFLLAPAPLTALALYATQVFLLTFWMGPTFAMAQAVAAPRMRAQASAVVLLTVNVIGQGLGPWLIGMLSDALSAALGSDGLRFALFAAVACAPWAALHSALAARTLRADLDHSSA
jgi:predicted MFS family arabinose efflux permease